MIFTRVLAAGPEATSTAARILQDGGLVAFPTETVYGLGADATNAAAVARLYAAKGRPRFNPLIAHVPDAAAACGLGRFDGAARTLASAFWPGPLTLVVPKAEGCPVSDLATAGLDTLALRVPDHPVAVAILAACGRPVVAPSANRSGHVSPTTAAHVVGDLAGRIDLVVDGGATPVGVESTIVACLGGTPRLLRPGGVPKEALEAALGGLVADPPAPTTDPGPGLVPDAGPIAPGMLSSHYAPRAFLRLRAAAVSPGEALLAFGPTLPPGAEGALAVLNLSERGDLAEAAARLFAHLRALDASGASVIAVAPIPRHGLGAAIADRLARAAAPRG
ncbi:L-threonylcarbamoyladenylate synthase [Rhodoplanes sp. TEM]|uniref:Threonylcarbamoyl-AMP synthase n=1 Tax=Rhodoplanes tepidamans TaxID=200616 RepID=A0ABT5J4A6_RHOTP|nr:MULTISPECIES: L-threonylcarbamoyladenylate synthase [Rhodoplanes]MDC7784469.1 L-threonylcarbamoyladenylate synthase [Rhodoplanes tepidamans]MDC7983499.1 L-threonylcarbamoyladenylate synthase [Rhodoplanes sp. TEM]